MGSFARRALDQLGTGPLFRRAPAGARYPPRSALQLARQQSDVGIKLGIRGAEPLDLLDRMNYSRVVATAKSAANVWQRLWSQLLRQVHGDLSRPGDLACSPGRGHLGLADTIMFSDLRLDFVDRNPPLVGAQHIGQHFLNERNVDRAAGHHGISSNT